MGVTSELSLGCGISEPANIYSVVSASHLRPISRSGVITGGEETLHVPSLQQQLQVTESVRSFEAAGTDNSGS